jgi:hypothetical protein
MVPQTRKAQSILRPLLEKLLQLEISRISFKLFLPKEMETFIFVVPNCFLGEEALSQSTYRLERQTIVPTDQRMTEKISARRSLSLPALIDSLNYAIMDRIIDRISFSFPRRLLQLSHFLLYTDLGKLFYY